jgi:hypothetical protein
MPLYAGLWYQQKPAIHPKQSSIDKHQAQTKKAQALHAYRSLWSQQLLPPFQLHVGTNRSVFRWQTGPDCTCRSTSEPTPPTHPRAKPLRTGTVKLVQATRPGVIVIYLVAPGRTCRSASEEPMNSDSSATAAGMAAACRDSRDCRAATASSSRAGSHWSALPGGQGRARRNMGATNGRSCSAPCWCKLIVCCSHAKSPHHWHLPSVSATEPALPLPPNDASPACLRGCTHSQQRNGREALARKGVNAHLPAACPPLQARPPPTPSC